jgi:hypothetical protein
VRLYCYGTVFHYESGPDCRMDVEIFDPRAVPGVLVLVNTTDLDVEVLCTLHERTYAPPVGLVDASDVDFAVLCALHPRAAAERQTARALALASVEVLAMEMLEFEIATAVVHRLIVALALASMEVLAKAVLVFEIAAAVRQRDCKTGPRSNGGPVTPSIVSGSFICTFRRDN